MAKTKKASALALYIANCIDHFKSRRQPNLKHGDVLKALEEIRHEVTEDMLKIRGLKRDPNWKEPA